jgi:probable HAF family extracellular repeat protein/YD repeat-containing protein
VPFDLNDRGQVVGSYLDAAGAPHGFLLEDGVYTEIETPGFPRAQLLGINDSGRIVGGYVDDGGTVHGLMRDERGRFTTFDAPGATTATGAININDRRQIVGIVR